MTAARESGTRLITNRLLLAIVIAGAVVLVNLLHWDYVSGDPIAYRQRMSEVFAGNVPYFGADFEHLPVMIVPMAAAWILGGFSSVFAYRSVWAVLTSVVLLVTAHVVEDVDAEAGSTGAARRWVWVTAPLVPLVVFRNDPWAVLPAMMAVAAALRARANACSTWLGIGALAKGWPLALVPLAWRKESRRGLSIMLALVGVVILALTQTPGFISGRSFDGIHTETLGGGLWLLSHRAVGLIETAGAIYVDAPRVAMVPGLVLGLTIALAALVRLSSHRGTTAERLIWTGALIIGILLAAPLQSAQFLLWASPFIVFSRSRVALFLYAAAAAFALVGVIGFDALASNAWWWSAMVVLRNLLLLVVAVLLLVRPGGAASGAEDVLRARTAVAGGSP